MDNGTDQGDNSTSAPMDHGADDSEEQAQSTKEEVHMGKTCNSCGATFDSQEKLDSHNAETHGGGNTETSEDSDNA